MVTTIFYYFKLSHFGGLLFVLLQDRQRNGEGSALAQLALALDVAIVQVNNLLDVGQSESEALHIVHVTCMHTIELLENLLHVLLLDAQTCITD